MRKRLRKTVVLTSRENFVWLSMQEIIPLIERNWTASAVPGQHEVVVRDVNRHPIGELLPELLAADNVVFTCFTVRLCKLGELLRGRFGIEARYFIYLHNQATILCWPFHAWGLGKHLREDDVFISSSSADMETFRHSFVKARVEVVPFTIPGLRSSYPAPRPARELVPFVYAGRISVQKNLHTLLYAFRLLRDRDPSLQWSLDVYGRDDDLGSPNMGMASTRYGMWLAALAKRLELHDRVRFLGYRPRTEVNRALRSRRHVAVSASLHSDENFGMAQFRSLCRANLAVLTRWGGYADFATHFEGRVFLTPVEETPRGPWVDPERLAKLLLRAAGAYAASSASVPPGARCRVPAYYSERRISRVLARLAMGTANPGAPLQMTPLAKRILEKQALYARGTRASGRIFESYADLDARIPFRGYLMSTTRHRARGETLLAGAGLRLRCFPWVDLGGRTVRVADPHRGELELALAPAGLEQRKSVLLTDWSGISRRASETTVRALLRLGYLHAVEGKRRAR